MTEDESESPPSAGADRDGDGYRYDFFKYLTSLSLLTLAGAFTISQNEGALEEIGRTSLAIVMGTVALAAIASFMGALEIVRIKSGGAPVGRRVDLLAQAAPGIYSLGVGGILMMFLDTLF
jgi:exosortase/archaeosortase